MGWLHQAIEHWSAEVDESDLGVDWRDAHERCWRCGHKRRLQKCHIVPKSLGGSDEVTNLVGLCGYCHDEQPDVDDPRETWRWIRETRATFYDEFHIQRGVEMAKQRGVDIERLDLGVVTKMMSRISRHIGQAHGAGFIKPSSVAWALEQAFNSKEGT